MKNKTFVKNIMGIMTLIWLSVFITGCLFTFTDPNDDDDDSSSSESITVETDAAKQEEYRKQWIENTKGIKVDNRYSGFADIWGDGKMALEFWFVDGNLWDAYYDIPDGYVLHKLLTDDENVTDKKTTFIDGNTAIMFIPRSAGNLDNALYIVKVDGNKIYRTENARGFAKLATWDGKTIPKSALEPDNLVIIATSKVPDVDMPFDTTESTQAGYKKQWLEAIKNITKEANYKTKDDVNIVGVSWPPVPVWFKNGDKIQYGGNDTVIYKLVTDNLGKKQAAFVDGNTAIMYYEDDLYNLKYLHILQIKDNKIYRVENYKGFATLDDWGGETIPKSALDNLVLFAEKVK